MNESLTCDCGLELIRLYGLPGMVLVCRCGKRWVRCLDKLVSEKEFHETAESWK